VLPKPDKLTELAGTTPNIIWLRSGQGLVALGGLSYLGANVAGVSFVSDGAAYAPLVIVFLGFISMYYGTRLAKIRQIAERIHELEMAGKRESND